ncbi:MAG: ATP-binding SpoIIE family protein phosphatase [Solirubrobacterales bacterium]
MSRLRRFTGRRKTAAAPTAPQATATAELAPVDIAPTDPALAYFASAGEVVDLSETELESPAIDRLRAAGVALVVPLVAQGELVGLMNLGPRLSEQDYTGDDRKLLDRLAAQAAPAVRTAQVLREHEAEVAARERVEQEMEVARLIQQNFLPHSLPEHEGWELAAHYAPARQVGGDFYDFIALEDGRLGVVVGDVTDKGVPAALVMAATRSVLRAAAQRMLSPGAVLERINEHLVPDIPPKMFVTCLYGILDPANGRFEFANAGHNLPYVRTERGVIELRATGMPLGLMPGMTYEETQATLAPGESVLLHSDGLAEAHDPQRQMFGFPRLMGMVGKRSGGQELIEAVLDELDRFTGPGWEQEDDITLVGLRRLALDELPHPAPGSDPAGSVRRNDVGAEDVPAPLVSFELTSEPGGERDAANRVRAAARDTGFPADRLDRLATAVAEATMNAMEHGNRYDPDRPVSIRASGSSRELTVEISDHGGARPIPAATTPDLEAKLAGEQEPRGWGLFLIEHMVDEMQIREHGDGHTVVLRLSAEGADDGDT